MTLPAITGRLDYKLGYIVPIDSTTWADTTATTWDSFTNWSIKAANPLVWLANPIDLGKITTFNLQINADYEGTIAYDIYTSSTGYFQGEETVTSILEGDSSVPAFTGRYVYVVAKVYRGSGLNVLKKLSITTSNTKAFDIYLYDLVTSQLAGSSTARTLPLGRTVGKVLTTTINIVSSDEGNYVQEGYLAVDYFTSSTGSYFAADYIDSGYVEDFGVSVPNAFQVSKDRTNPTICLRNQNGDYVDGVVDAIVRVLPEQYMFNGQLLIR
jgi:hypothetical protein